MPLNASVTLKQKKKMLYVPIDFSNGVTIDALVDSGAYVSAIPEDELERIKPIHVETYSKWETHLHFKYRLQTAS